MSCCVSGSWSKDLLHGVDQLSVVTICYVQSRQGVNLNGDGKASLKT
jgi:hypothetical protein